jgi:large-conductance mechanosensitive channel
MQNSVSTKAGSEFVQEFMGFLKKFGVIGLAIGVVVGGAVKEFVDVIVTTLIDPIVKVILGAINFKPGGKITLVGENALLIGDLISGIINFVVLIAIVFVAVKFILSKFMTKEEMDAIK